MYSVFDWKEFEILSYRQAFLESTEISASEEPNALEKVPVQFMPLQKFSGKCHFLIRFCTSNWSETYVIAFTISGFFSSMFLMLDLVPFEWVGGSDPGC